MEGTAGHHGGRKGSRQPALRCRSTSRQTAVLLRGARGVRDAREALDGPWDREFQDAGVELICVGANDDETIPPHGVGRSETTYVARLTVEVVEELRFDGVVNCVAADAILIQMAQSRRQIGGPTTLRSQKNFDYRCTWARIQTGFWRSALPVGRLAPCPILNYGCEWCCSNVSDVFVWCHTDGEDDPTCIGWQ